MSGYRLADGSFSTDYEVGDEFATAYGYVELSGDNDLRGRANVKMSGKGFSEWWSQLTPTPETKRKVQERKGASWFVDNDDCTEVKVNINLPQGIHRPLARIVDWRGGENLHHNDIVVGSDGVTLDYPTFQQRNGELGKNDWNTVIRINTDALPKQPTITRSEAEAELGVKIVEDDE